MSEERTNGIGQRLREVRGGMSQAEFAEVLGVHQNTIVNYETGKRVPDSSIILNLFLRMQVDPTWLVTGHHGSNSYNENSLRLLKEFRVSLDEAIANLEKGTG
jgi:transcriptional regulator with XRE-family HTH domain